LIFDNQALFSHRALAAVLGVILQLPPLKQAMASEQLKSRYLENGCSRGGKRSFYNKGGGREISPLSIGLPDDCLASFHRPPHSSRCGRGEGSPRFIESGLDAQQQDFSTDLCAQKIGENRKRQRMGEGADAGDRFFIDPAIDPGGRSSCAASIRMVKSGLKFPQRADEVFRHGTGVDHEQAAVGAGKGAELAGHGRARRIIPAQLLPDSHEGDARAAVEKPLAAAQAAAAAS
jgi:hypothetical protein